MFFGAGNLILPPLLGVQAGTDALPALVGFLVAGVGLPVLGIVVVALSGTLRDLASRVHPTFARAFVALVYLLIGPCLAIPRTASTAFEMLVPLLPAGVSPELARLAFSVAFFALAFVLAMRPGRLTRLLGRVTGPALILLIVAVVLAALASLAGAGALPAAEPTPAYASGAAAQGFLTGYQTMDLLASLTFGLVIATNVRSLGVTGERGVMREVCRAGAVAGALMIAVYGGLAAVGVEQSEALVGATNGAEVITASATAHFGVAGDRSCRRDLPARLPQRVRGPHQLLRILLRRGDPARLVPRLRDRVRRLLLRGLEPGPRRPARPLRHAARVPVPGRHRARGAGAFPGAPGHGHAPLALDRPRHRRRERRRGGARRAGAPAEPLPPR